jgi:hypothetical protein
MRGDTYRLPSAVPAHSKARAAVSALRNGAGGIFQLQLSAPTSPLIL